MPWKPLSDLARCKGAGSLPAELPAVTRFIPAAMILFRSYQCAIAQRSNSTILATFSYLPTPDYSESTAQKALRGRLIIAL